MKMMKPTRAVLTSLMSIVLTMLSVVAVAATPFRSAKGYAITPPTGWQIEQSGVAGTDVVFHAPPLHGFSAMINAVVDKAPLRADLHSALLHINAVYPRIFKGYKRVEQSSVTLDGTSALLNIANYQAGTPPRLLRMRQVVALKNGQLYLFTCTCLAADYPHFSATFAAALKSIHWTK